METTIATRRPHNKLKKQKNSVKPIKVVYISNPMRVKTTASKFRALVQELTGRYSNVDSASFTFSDDNDNSTSEIDGVRGVPDHHKMVHEETSHEVPRVDTASPCNSLSSSTTATTTLTCSSSDGDNSSWVDYDFDQFLQQYGDLENGFFVPQVAAGNLNGFF